MLVATLKDKYKLTFFVFGGWEEIEGLHGRGGWVVAVVVEGVCGGGGHPPPPQPPAPKPLLPTPHPQTFPNHKNINILTPWKLQTHII